MQTPFQIIQDKIIVPLSHFRKTVLSRSGMYKGTQKFAQFVFDKSKETALVMLAFNAISIISSHFSQIQGLKKGKRENKDYLIKQEWAELFLDTSISIIPSFILNNALTKMLDSGKLITKSTYEKLLYEITPQVGCKKDELFQTDHIVPVTETLKKGISNLINKVKKILPAKIGNKIKEQIFEPANHPQMSKLERCVDQVDAAFHNGQPVAYDNIIGQRNGLLIMSTILYSVIASNIIMPILKNKVSNYCYRKDLEKNGETPESIRRKRKFANLISDEEITNNERSDIFNIFRSDTVNTENPPNINSKKINRQIYNNLKFPENKNTFKDITSYSNYNTQSTGLRI